jgi:ammonia channel protein AmtB
LAQAAGVAIVALWSGVVTLLLAEAVALAIPMRVS